MNKKELNLLDRFASKYKIDCVPSEGKYDFWDFTYEWDNRKFYCEMKQRSFTLELAKSKYPRGYQHLVTTHGIHGDRYYRVLLW